ncbi:zinc finger BED domain-containing protein 4-like [Lithobates pipiens]
MMAEKKSNPVWQYFSEPTSGKGKCNICQKLLSMGAEKGKAKNTTNMWNHLKVHHLQAYKGAQREKEDAASSSANFQPTVVQMFDSKRKWQNTDPRSKKIDTLITEMIATDNQPFTVVADIGFQRLLATIEPRYSIKSEKYYRTDMLDSVYKKVTQQIKTLITTENAGPYLSFTTDCWSGEAESLMSLTCHFIDSNWERKQVVLNVKAMSGSHTGDYIREMFLSMLNDWDINQDRVVLVLRDSGANMIKGLRLADIPDLSCSAHTLQLVVKEGISSQRVVGDIIAKLKTCATHFSHSVLAKQRLGAIQKDLGLPQQSIIQDVPTRWNSTLHMLQRMLEQKRALNLYVAEHGKFTTPPAEQWDIISNLIDTLGPIEEVTLDISKAEASISCIIPCIAVLKMVLQAEGHTTRGIQTLRETMWQSMERRFTKIEDTKCLVLATLLDPRYKAHVFASDTLSKAKTWLREENAIVSEQKRATSGDEGPEPKRTRTRAEEKEEPSPSGLLEKMYANILGAHGTPAEESDEQLISEQLEKYLQEPLIDRRTGLPLEWWKQNASRLCHLAPLARKFLCPPASSVPSERVFSEIGIIYDKKRSRLTGENAERLCFLNYNLKLLNWEYQENF